MDKYFQTKLLTVGCWLGAVVYKVRNFIGMFRLLLLLVSKMTECRTIKVSKETYAELSQIAGELQVKLKWPVSLEDAIKHLTKKRKKGTKISDLAGLLKDMTDEEASQMEAAIDESWKRWRTPE
jgi:hypothetical protein